jgi:hypothetical protein
MIATSNQSLQWIRTTEGGKAADLQDVSLLDKCVDVGHKPTKMFPCRISSGLSGSEKALARWVKVY